MCSSVNMSMVAVCMARLEISGMDDLNAAFHRIGSVPGEVTTRALNDMAAIAAKEIRLSGESMGVYDPESSVHVLDKITTAKAKLTTDGGHQDITFSGTRPRGNKRVRNAEIAFINEYGKRGQAARPFIGKAMTANEEKIADAGADIIGDWFEKSF